MKNITIDHLNLSVRNFEESAIWYKNVFGFEKVEEGTDEKGKPWGILRNGNFMLCIYEEVEGMVLDYNKPEHARFHQIFHFGLRVRDEKEWQQTLNEQKLKVFYGGAVRYPHSQSWYIQDPTGYEIEVSCWDDNEISFG